ncbi:hypothetical protein C5167_007139 [Papaver somniferum]|uniref:HAT C-terminal dimerisation domain-containing protein n=1 Tax=Papaver somniferum TaxID=3469 RepID=A0A4Y7JIE3_PAPSO|nr:hypothetical protein C5167_007139 [Papaver somniferum]
MMFKKYNAYWGDYEDMNSVMYFAKLLDPREKEFGLKFDLECLYEQDDFRVTTVLKAVKQVMGRLYDEYNNMYSNANAEEGTGSTSAAGVDDMVVSVQEENIEDMLESRKKRRRMNVHNTHPKSELERYLLDDCEASTKEFDILAWWQANSTKYKVLSLMAKDILAIPVSSVASESAFSTGKRILTPWRSSLSVRTVEALLCTQSWLQKPISLDFPCDYVPDDNSNIEDVSVRLKTEPNTEQFGYGFNCDNRTEHGTGCDFVGASNGKWNWQSCNTGDGIAVGYKSCREYVGGSNEEKELQLILMGIAGIRDVH